MSDIYVFGSLNTDMTIECPRMPEAGETLAGGGFLTTPGGKGANQAVACARLGGRTHFCGRAGDDLFGRRLRENLEEAGAGDEYAFALALVVGFGKELQTLRIHLLIGIQKGLLLGVDAFVQGFPVDCVSHIGLHIII